jgi:hypothetical protein
MSAPPSFSPNTPNKIGNGINVSGKNTLISTEFDDTWRAAIAFEPIDAKVDGKKLFCVRVDHAGNSDMMIGFTPMETFDSNTMYAYFGNKGFTGCGILLNNGYLYYPDNNCHEIIYKEICKEAKEIIVILTISNNGAKKEIQFIVDGIESKSSDVSEYLKAYLLFPSICLYSRNQQITTISIDQMKRRTPEIDKLVNKQKGFPFLRFVSVSNAFRQKYPLLQQHEELGRKFLQQREILFRGLMARMKLEIEAKQ